MQFGATSTGPYKPTGALELVLNYDIVPTSLHGEQLLSTRVQAELSRGSVQIDYPQRLRPSENVAVPLLLRINEMDAAAREVVI